MGDENAVNPRIATTNTTNAGISRNRTSPTTAGHIAAERVPVTRGPASTTRHIGRASKESSLCVKNAPTAEVDDAAAKYVAGRPARVAISGRRLQSAGFGEHLEKPWVGGQPGVRYAAAALVDPGRSDSGSAFLGLSRLPSEPR